MSKLESRELKSKRPTVIKISKLNDVTGTYNTMNTWTEDAKGILKHSRDMGLGSFLSYALGIDFAVGKDRTGAIEVNPNMEVTANFEVIEEKPEQKQITEGGKNAVC